MDTPDKAISMAHPEVADTVNQEWLLKSAQSSSLSNEFAERQRNWNSESLPHRAYGATGMIARLDHASSPSSASQSIISPRCLTAVRHQLWSKGEPENGAKSIWPVVRGDRLATTSIDNAYQMNVHLYDNITCASDAPLLSPLQCKLAPTYQAHCDTSNSSHLHHAQANASDRQFCLGKFRIFLACFVLLGITLANYSRNALSLAAVGMIASNVRNRELVSFLAIASEPASRPHSNATYRIETALDGSCPIREASLQQARRFESGGSLLAGPTSSADAISAYELQLIRAKRRDQLESEFRASIERRVGTGELVDWTPGQQGLISAAGSVGNLLIAVPLTRLGEIYGPKWVIFSASLGATIQAALMPVVSSCNLAMVILFQVIFSGLTYGADCVAYTLFAHWLTPTEMAFFVSCLIICYQLGTMLSSFVTAFILSHGFAWSWCFYTPAILCGLWTLVWWIIGASEPQSSWLISSAELTFLARRSKIAQTRVGIENGGTTQIQEAAFKWKSATSQPVSWRRLSRDPNIWAIIAVKFTLRWYFSAYLSLMPTYLSSVGHMPIETIGKMSVAQSFIGLFSGLLMGYWTKSLASGNPFGLSLATIRKCFQSIVNFGLALSLLVFIAYDCNQTLTIVSLTIGGFCISFYVAGALQIPLDLSPTHCGLITSITNTLALGQALGAPISGLILNEGPTDRWRWRIVWGLAIVTNTLSGLIFIFLVDSKPHDYSKC